MRSIRLPKPPAMMSCRARRSVKCASLCRSLYHSATKSAANGTTVNHISGDGLIVATATGSTAYSLSAGGPVVEPTARNLIVSPICAHSVHANSYVLSPERTVTVQTEKTGYKPIFLSADGGRAFSLRNGDAVEIRRSKYETKLVRLSNKSFCDILQKKMLMGVLGHEE